MEFRCVLGHRSQRQVWPPWIRPQVAGGDRVVFVDREPHRAAELRQLRGTSTEPTPVAASTVSSTPSGVTRSTVMVAPSVPPSSALNRSSRPCSSTTNEVKSGETISCPTTRANVLQTDPSRSARHLGGGFSSRSWGAGWRRERYRPTDRAILGFAAQQGHEVTRAQFPASLL